MRVKGVADGHKLLIGAFLYRKRTPQHGWKR
jgi:hypothetical protein